MELQVIQNRVFEVRGYRVMVDFHLAEMYQVETRTQLKNLFSLFPNFFQNFIILLSKNNLYETD